MRILLVSHQQETLSVLSELLGRTTSKQTIVDTASTLKEAAEHLRSTTHDIVLSDLRSDAEMALQLSKEIEAKGASVPVIFLGEHLSGTASDKKGNGRLTHSPQIKGREALWISHLVQQAIEEHSKKRQCEQIETSLCKLQGAVEYSSELVAITDSSGIIEYVNPAFETVTGYSSGEVIGRTLRILKSGEEKPEVYREMWETILAGGMFRGTVVNRKKNGETFVAEKTIAPIRRKNGQITHFVSYDRDITEQRELLNQLQQARKMDAIGRLAGGIAHDFNNLLLIVSAYAELMLDAVPSGSPLRNNVQQILTAARRAANLTRQLLAFSRKQMQVLELLDLNMVIKEINRMLPRLIGEDIDIQVVAGSDLGKVKADPGQVEQIVMNLAANARDAMPHGGKITIETMNTQLDGSYVHRHSMVPPGDYVLLSITDTGTGISPEHLPHIFEPFYTTKEEGKGTGLGLATVYGIVKQNAGFIWVYSEVGMGTVFKVYLPRAEEGPSRRPILDSPEVPTEGSETIMLVEDEPQVRQSASEFLRLKGYRVLEAENGERALKVSRNYTGKIDLVITDVVMPRVGGTQLAQEIKITRPDMKVLFVSGYAENTVLRHGTIDLVGHFLPKPFTLKALALKVREVLGRQGLAAHAASASS